VKPHIARGAHEWTVYLRSVYAIVGPHAKIVHNGKSTRNGDLVVFINEARVAGQMKNSPPSTLLGALERLQHVYGAEVTQDKLELLQSLDESMLRSADDVSRLHDVLCFMRAYPDNRKILNRVEDMLTGFANRKDLQRYRLKLSDTGIAGTHIHYRFHWKTAKWLYDHWPEAITIDWTEFEDPSALEELWPLLLPPPAQETLEHMSMSPRKWIETLKKPDETDAAFLVRIFARWHAGEAVREKSYDDLDVPFTLLPVVGSPSRTHAQVKPKKPAYGPPGIPVRSTAARAMPKPLNVLDVSPRHGRTLINLARIQMVTRSRDLYAFMNADSYDVRILTFDSGIQFVSYGLLPHARTLLEAMYVFLILKNGLPVGYTQAATLFRSAEINFNVFDTFRGAETSRIFGLTLAMVRHMFQCDTFIINTQQLGEDNDEALKTGAFWFYHKHGFRSRNRDIRAIVRRELEHKKRNPRHRSDLKTLRQLAGDELYLSTGKARGELVNSIPGAAIGLIAARMLESHASASDPTGTRRCINAASKLLGCRIDSRFPLSQWEAWERWSPVVLSLPGIRRWSVVNRRALAEVINAKGGHRESDFVALFDKHRTLQKAILKLGG